VNFLILLAVAAVFAYRLTSAEDRARYLAIAADAVVQLRAAARRRDASIDAFRAALRARSPRLVVTPAIAAANLIVFGGLLFGAGAIANPDTLIAWGASIGPRTTNGEWWRLATSAFVHTGLVQLFLTIAILLQLGRLLERLAGPLAFATVYLSAAVFASLVRLSFQPVDVGAGASGAIAGLYGLLLSALFAQFILQRRAPSEPNAEPSAEAVLTIPVMELKRLAIGAGMFLVYTAATGRASAAEGTALLAGLGYGLLVLPGATMRQPALRRVAIGSAVAAALAVAGALPLRGIADVKPEIARVIATEEKTASSYTTAWEAFRKQRVTERALAQLVEAAIMPELRAVDARLAALTRVPPEHQPLVADAREFLRLRYDSWRLRLDAIRRTSAAPRRAAEDGSNARWRMQAEAKFRSNRAAMGNAEGAERASMAAFERVRAPLPTHVP
jgi:membrane associated rhomboid family serine protease